MNWNWIISISPNNLSNIQFERLLFEVIIIFLLNEEHRIITSFGVHFCRTCVCSNYTTFTHVLWVSPIGSLLQVSRGKLNISISVVALHLLSSVSPSSHLWWVLWCGEHTPLQCYSNTVLLVSLVTRVWLQPQYSAEAHMNIYMAMRDHPERTEPRAVVYVPGLWLRA